jgi:hypothetical protein
MEKVTLGCPDLRIGPICQGPMTVGGPVGAKEACAVLGRALELGVDLIDTAEMHLVPPRRESSGATPVVQFEGCLAAWPPEPDPGWLAAIDAIRGQQRNPAQ